jgi:hypothetical protein
VSRLASVLVLLSLPAWAQRAFPITWGSQTLAPQSHEFQSWATARLGRQDLGYTEFDLRLQAAQGIAERVDTMFGFDVDLASFALDSRTVDARVSNTWRFSMLKANEVIGVSVLGRLGLGVDIGELEVRLIVDKQFGPLWLALNGSAARSQFWSGRTGIDTRFEQSFGARYQVQEAFAAGVEFRAREALQMSTFQGTAYSGGPTFTYTAKRWWFALSLMVQAGADKAAADKGNGEPLELRDNERFLGRVVFGVKTD